MQCVMHYMVQHVVHRMVHRMAHGRPARAARRAELQRRAPGLEHEARVEGRTAEHVLGSLHGEPRVEQRAVDHRGLHALQRVARALHEGAQLEAELAQRLERVRLEASRRGGIGGGAALLVLERGEGGAQRVLLVLVHQAAVLRPRRAHHVVHREARAIAAQLPRLGAAAPHLKCDGARRAIDGGEHVGERQPRAVGRAAAIRQRDQEVAILDRLAASGHAALDDLGDVCAAAARVLAKVDA